MLKSFHHFSNMCQGHLFPPSQSSLHVKLKISEFLANVTPTRWLSWEQPTSLSLRKRSNALNSDTGRATESYKLCSQEKPAPKSPPFISTVWHVFLKKLRNFQSKDFSEKILVTFSYSPAKTIEVTSIFGRDISFSLLLQGPLLPVWFIQLLLTSFKLTVPSCTQGLTNDCRFQCIVLLLEYANTWFFINLLLLSVYVRLRNTRTGNRNCDINFIFTFSGSLWGKSFLSLWIFHILTNSASELFLKDTLNPKWPKRTHQMMYLYRKMRVLLRSASWIPPADPHHASSVSGAKLER